MHFTLQQFKDTRTFFVVNISRQPSQISGSKTSMVLYADFIEGVPTKQFLQRLKIVPNTYTNAAATSVEAGTSIALIRFALYLYCYCRFLSWIFLYFQFFY